MKILIICTGNTCRSQMAEAFLKSFDQRLKVFSAGTHAEAVINPKTVMVMKEAGIDVSAAKPKNVNQFLGETFNYVITVCDTAKNVCPVFTGKVLSRLHIGFEDPASFNGSHVEVVRHYRRIREEIKEKFYDLYTNRLLPELEQSKNF